MDRLTREQIEAARKRYEVKLYEYRRDNERYEMGENSDALMGIALCNMALRSLQEDKILARLNEIIEQHGLNAAPNAAKENR